MDIKVISNEQTPRVDDIIDVKLFLDQNINELQAFKEYAETRSDAVGLAANQVSFDDYRFMVRAFALRDMKTKLWRLIIDPQITEYIGMKETKCEGCLTWKNSIVVAERYRAVRVNYYNEDGEKFCDEIYHGFEGQIWQHEINHLNGIEETIMPAGTPEPKSISIGRNDKCPCNSGKKYKNCCLLYL